MFFINPFIYGGAAGNFESIATVTVGSGGAANIEFTSIGSGWQHLQIRMISRDDRSASAINTMWVQFNSDTGSNYSYHGLFGNGSSASADAGASQVETVASISTGAGASASVFGAAIIDVLDYASTSKYKTLRSFHGADNNGSGSVRIRSGLWMSTSAITSIKLYPASASFVQHTTAALYGIKAP